MCSPRIFLVDTSRPAIAAPICQLIFRYLNPRFTIWLSEKIKQFDLMHETSYPVAANPQAQSDVLFEGKTKTTNLHNFREFLFTVVKMFLMFRPRSGAPATKHQTSGFCGGLRRVNILSLHAPFVIGFCHHNKRQVVCFREKASLTRDRFRIG